MDDPHISSAWKLLPTLSSPEHFALALDEYHPAMAGDEGYWSHAYMNSRPVSDVYMDLFMATQHV